MKHLDLWDIVQICIVLPAALMLLALAVDLAVEWIGWHGIACWLCDAIKIVGVV
jgi:hypothetical protein